MTLSLKIKITLCVVTSILTLGLATAGIHLSADRKTMTEALTSHGTTMAEALASAIDEGMAAEDLDFIKKFSGIVHTKDVVLAQVYSTLWLPLDSQPFTMLDERPVEGAKRHFQESFVTYVEDQGDCFDIYAPVYYHQFDRYKVSAEDWKRYLIGYVRLKISTAAMRQAATGAVVREAIASVVVSLLTIFLLSAFIRRQVLRPIEALQQSVIRHKTGELPTAVDDSGAVSNEIGALTTEFNLMSQAIREREERLAEEKERLHVTLRSIGDGVITTDTEGRVVIMNRAAEVMTGRRMAEAAGRPLAEVFHIIHEQSGEPCENPAAKVLKTGGVIELANHTVLIGKDGSRRVIADSGAPIKEASGTVIGVVLVFRDVTEKTRMEAAIRESEEKFKGFAEQSFVGIYLVQDGVFKYVNPRFAEMFGYTVDECLAGMAPETIVHPDDVALVNAAIAQRLAGEVTTLHYEFKGRKKNGEAMAIEVYGAVTTLSNRPAAIGTAMDITERKASLEKLEQKTAELERFTYTISHDLKSPIITIKGFLGTLVADAKAGRFERMESDINRIAKAADKMRSLLEDVLELSRIGRMVNPSVEFSMTEVTHEAIEGLAAMIAAAGVTITVAEAMPRVYADRHRIREVMQNLIENAIKYLGDQPAPRIEVGHGTLADGRQAYCVTDNGIGIDPKFHDKVFGLFEKLDPHSEGTGIGLALVKRIVELHGGSIWVESPGGGPGQGTTFYFTLPQ